MRTCLCVCVCRLFVSSHLFVACLNHWFSCLLSSMCCPHLKRKITRFPLYAVCVLIIIIILMLLVFFTLSLVSIHFKYTPNELNTSLFHFHFSFTLSFNSFYHFKINFVVVMFRLIAVAQTKLNSAKEKKEEEHSGPTLFHDHIQFSFCFVLLFSFWLSKKNSYENEWLFCIYPHLLQFISVQIIIIYNCRIK